MNKFKKLTDELKIKIDDVIEEGYKLSKGKNLTEHERDLIIQSIIDKKVEMGISYVLKTMKNEIENCTNEVTEEIKELRLTIDKYCKKKMRCDR